jgi:fibronectin type 3 domain-containing protein
MFSLMLLVFISGATGWMVKAEEGGGEENPQQLPQYAELGPTFSEEGFIISEPVQRLVLVADENPTKQSVQIPLDENIDLSTKGVGFNITYVASGGYDEWGEPCLSFPSQAMNAFNYAANIWASTISSTVPITIRACWADLGSTSILGYSGGYYVYKNFPGATYSNTYYASSLANALSGTDLGPGAYDMHITYNTNFGWYFGTDANPAPGTMDFVTVATHEIAHGLNFSGSAKYSSGSGSYGIDGYPMVYDIFMRDGSGNLLTSYASPSTSLGTLLSSNNLWFHGQNAMVANGGSRVKIYAPTSWSSGSSYSHLDYNTFSSTVNNMMVYAITYGTANHNPGPVTIGLLKDLGWNLAAVIPTSVAASDGTYADKVIVSWDASANVTYYQVFRNTSDTTTGATTLTNNHTVSLYNDTTAVAGTLYYYWVKACNTTGCSEFSQSDSGYRAAAVLTPPTGVDASDGTYNDKVRISWNASAGANHYEVFRNTINSTAGAVQLFDNQLESPFDDSTAIVDTEYYYWVKACDDLSCSDYSLFDIGYKSFTTVNTPTGVSASDGVYSDKVSLTWNTVTGANKYKVFRNTSNSTSGAYEFPDVITENLFDDLLAEQGIIYYYWVQACNNSSCSDYSNFDSGYVKSIQTLWNIFLPLVNNNYPNVDPILNGDFEGGQDGLWTEYSSIGFDLILPQESLLVPPHSGSWAVWLGGDDYETSRLSQSILISSSRPYLHFWYWIGSEDICDSDFFKLKINSNIVNQTDLCTSTSTSGWVEQVVNLSGYTGSTVTMMFEVINDFSLNSNFFLDDVSMSSVSTSSAVIGDEILVLGDVASRKVK